MGDKYIVVECRIILGQYHASYAIFRPGIFSVDPHLFAGVSPAARLASWLWSLSANVRRNGGPGRQRRISSRVPRWVSSVRKVVSNKLLRCWTAVYLMRQTPAGGLRLSLPLLERWRWISRHSLTGAGSGHGSGINYQPFSRSFIWIWRIFLSVDFACCRWTWWTDTCSKHVAKFKRRNQLTRQVNSWKLHGRSFNPPELQLSFIFYPSPGLSCCPKLFFFNTLLVLLQYRRKLLIRSCWKTHICKSVTSVLN